MSVEQINEIIVRDLYEDAYARQTESPKKYKGKQLAHRMESMLYICPFCSAHDSMHSEKDKVECKECKQSFTYDEYGMLHGLEFDTVKALAAWQAGEMQKDVENGAVYTADGARVSTVKDHTETFICEGAISMSRDELKFGDITVPISEISDLAMHGKYTLVLSVGKDYYEIVIPQTSNAYKFFIMYKELTALTAVQK